MSKTRAVDSKWTWFTDYAYFHAGWTLNSEAGRMCEVGMGIKAFGKPRGERIKFTGHAKFTTIGMGAIYVRVCDVQGPCYVQLDQGDIGALTVFRKDIP